MPANEEPRSTPDDSAALRKRIDPIADQFDAAWQKALKGWEPPNIESFLNAAPESDRLALRRELELIDQEYRQRVAPTEDIRSGVHRAEGSRRFSISVHLGPGPAPGDSTRHSDAEQPAQAPRGTHTSPGLPSTVAHDQSPVQPVADHQPAIRVLGDYELLEEIGHGGMGVVYKAKETRTSRIVALKMIRDKFLDSPNAIRRFQTEAEHAASLDHPNIVPIYHVGESDGSLFFTMKHVEKANGKGKSLAQAMHDGEIRGPELAARTVQTISRAVHYAHSRGILHRDLKPGNVLLDQDGQPHVADFGLAKRLGTDVHMTAAGFGVGTVEYMAPEQAAGRKDLVSVSSDVYSLGAILFELLTGRPPFQRLPDEEHEDACVRLQVTPIPAPRSLKPSVPADLETISLKCLEKDPAARYALAQELSDDLRRFLSGEPILGRRIGPIRRLRLWCRRNPVVAGLTAAVLIVCAAGFIGVTWQWLRAERNVENVHYRLVRQYVANGVRLMDEGDLFGSLVWFAEALKLDEGHPEFEEVHRVRLGAVIRMCPKLMQLWFHEAPARHAEFSPDGRFVIVSSKDAAQVWDVGSGEPITRPLEHAGEVLHASFSPDGRLMVTTSGKTIVEYNGPITSEGQDQVWDVSTGRPISPLVKHDREVNHAAFSPDGRRLATASDDKTARIWDALTGVPLTPPLKHSGPVNHVAFSPDGRHVLTSVPLTLNAHDMVVADEGEARVWDASTGKPVIPPLKHSGPVKLAAFSHDGRRIVTASS
ncbi:MAG: serine/threonine protein kinase, partial [Planctomycetes bacterium]|nr:serine/threonine protein kinase [Planctomycetota bacterium]